MEVQTRFNGGWREIMEGYSLEVGGILMRCQRVVFTGKQMSQFGLHTFRQSSQAKKYLTTIVSLQQIMRWGGIIGFLPLFSLVGMAYKCAQLCLTLWHSMDCRPPCSPVHGIFQVRIMEWAVISSFRGSSQLRDWNRGSCISCIGRQILYNEATLEGKILMDMYVSRHPALWHPSFLREGDLWITPSFPDPPDPA